ncbi:M3 family metallopeptidase [Deinococcus sp.]|uniref:M3 family metallopeptidase n=1 Tax=Deinococcus sp. TaxID=47478 RepID=UPI0028699471|nr:M3 family metallopeptidase [Deinococcus sp.]
MHVSEPLDDVMLDLLATRRQLARNADEPDFMAYQWKVLDQVDYAPADCRAFHEAVQVEVAPVLAAMVQQGAEQLGLDSVRPWDYSRNTLLDPQGCDGLPDRAAPAGRRDLNTVNRRPPESGRAAGSLVLTAGARSVQGGAVDPSTERNTAVSTGRWSSR